MALHLELCVKILRGGRSAPETHESGEISARAAPHGGTPAPCLKGEELIAPVEQILRKNLDSLPDFACALDLLSFRYYLEL